jgi:hypothetical protein
MEYTSELHKFWAGIFTLLGFFTLSLSCAILDASCLSLVEEVLHYLSWMLFLALWWKILGKEGFNLAMS